MYESFYGFREQPFSLLPDPAFLYVGKKHRKTLTKLRSGVMNQAGITLITGEIGSGKTTLIQHLMGQFKKDTTVGLINNTRPAFGDLMQWILHAFNVSCNANNDVKLHQAFLKFVQGEAARKRRTLLIVDEAQNMSPELLEELRLLTNVNIDYPLFQVVLVGQPELRNTLRRPELQQFAQRIAVEHHLDPLDVEETGEYIGHRIQVAGGDPALFQRQACELVHRYSHGVPRLINSLCNTALLYGYDENKTTIDGPLMSEIVPDEKRGELLAFGTAGGTVEQKTRPEVNSGPERMAASEEMGRLAVTRGGKLHGEYVLNGTSLAIGSQRDNDIVLSAPEVSTYHARIQISNDGHYLEDLGSASGITVNSRRVLGYSLQDGDTIRIGGYTLAYRNHRTMESSQDEGSITRGSQIVAAQDGVGDAIERKTVDKVDVSSLEVSKGERDLDGALRVLVEMLE